MARKFLLVVTLAATSLTACGPNTVSAQQFAAEVCPKLKEMVDAAQRGIGEFTEAATQGASPDAAKQALADFLGEMATKAREAAEAAENAGVPDVENGEEDANTLQSGLQQASETLEEAENKLNEAEVANPQELQELFGEVQGDMQGAMQGVQDIEGTQLEEEMKKNEDCQALEAM